jgi:hypothetical protein
MFQRKWGGPAQAFPNDPLAIRLEGRTWGGSMRRGLELGDMETIATRKEP